MKAVIIGSGMSGLVIASYLVQSGNDVIICEQNSFAGGVTATIQKNGFKWDLGPLLLDGFGENEEANNILKELNVMDRINIIREDRGMVFPDFDLWKPEKYEGLYWRKEKLKLLFPEDTRGLDNYYRFYDSMMLLSAISRELEQTRAKKLNLFPKLRMFLIYQKIKNMFGWSAKQLMEFYFSNPELRAVYTSILADFCALPAEFPAPGIPLSNIETAFDKRIPLKIKNKYKYPGYYYIKGGVGKIVEALVEKIVSSGGILMTGKTVTKILIEGGQAKGVLLQDGTSLDADVVIASGGAREIFFNLVGRENLTREYIENIESLQLQESVLMVQLGINSDPLKYQKAALCYYYGTYDVDNAIMNCRSGLYHEGKDGFVVYVPSAHSPEMAPEGYHSVTIYTIAPNKLKDMYWSDYTSYYADKLIKEAEYFIPGLSSNIIEKIILTPEDFRKLTNLEHHALGGFVPVMGKTNPSHLTPVKGLFFIGAQSESAGGITNVMKGAKKTYNNYLQNYTPDSTAS
jgi:phytoene dehydrogenase-like protein